jgi:formamidopyrimidine-DNA glycosylase
MPELPEVEGYRATVERAVVGREIVRARFLDDWMLKEPSPAAAARRLRGRRAASAHRRGKLLLLGMEARRGEADAPVLAMHFGMTGHPVVERNGEDVHRWDRAVLHLDDGTQFHYRNARRLGSLRVVTRTDVPDLLWRYGPEPLEAPLAWFREALATRRGPVKAVLLDQSFLAGVGNIYADEALLAAGVRPMRPANSLRPDEAAELHAALRRILRRAVKAHIAGRDSRFPLMDVRRDASRGLALTGQPATPCPVCGRELSWARLGGRTSFYCRRCQR